MSQRITLETFKKFPPTAVLLGTTTVNNFEEVKNQYPSASLKAEAMKLYNEFCANMQDYINKVRAEYKDIKALDELADVCHQWDLSRNIPIGKVIDRLILSFVLAQNHIMTIENDIRETLGYANVYTEDSTDYVSDIDSLLADYQKNFPTAVDNVAPPPAKKTMPVKLPAISPQTRNVIVVLAIVIVLFVLYLMFRKEKMYGPSDILVDRQQLVRIATMPRPIPPNYSRWY